jgi:hypothetical protein
VEARKVTAELQQLIDLAQAEAERSRAAAEEQRLILQEIRDSQRRSGG